MPSPVFTYILNMWFVNTFCRYTQLNDQSDVFLTIQFSISQQRKWFQVLLCITNNSIKHQPFVDTELNDQTVLFLTSQFSISQQSWMVPSIAMYC